LYKTRINIPLLAGFACAGFSYCAYSYYKAKAKAENYDDDNKDKDKDPQDNFILSILSAATAYFFGKETKIQETSEKYDFQDEKEEFYRQQYLDSAYSPPPFASYFRSLLNLLHEKLFFDAQGYHPNPRTGFLTIQITGFNLVDRLVYWYRRAYYATIYTTFNMPLTEVYFPSEGYQIPYLTDLDSKRKRRGIGYYILPEPLINGLPTLIVPERLLMKSHRQVVRQGCSYFFSELKFFYEIILITQVQAFRYKSIRKRLLDNTGAITFFIGPEHFNTIGAGRIKYQTKTHDWFISGVFFFLRPFLESNGLLILIPNAAWFKKKLISLGMRAKRVTRAPRNIDLKRLGRDMSKVVVISTEPWEEYQFHRENVLHYTPERDWHLPDAAETELYDMLPVLKQISDEIKRGNDAREVLTHYEDLDISRISRRLRTAQTKRPPGIPY